MKLDFEQFTVLEISVTKDMLKLHCVFLLGMLCVYDLNYKKLVNSFAILVVLSLLLLKLLLIVRTRKAFNTIQ